MRTLTTPRLAGRLLALVAISGLVVTFGATDAWADTSNATAQAINLTLGGGSVANSGTQSASNPGGQPTVTSGAQPSLSVLGSQNTVAAGVLVQTAVAGGNGNSAACAGLVGPGGSIQVGATTDCAVTGATTGGITINLPGAVVLHATAILEECHATSNGAPPTASAQLVDATIDVLGMTAVSLPINPSAGQQVSAFLLSLDLNNQSHPMPGEIQGTALSLSVLNTIGLNIGVVTCGPNAATVVTSAFPAKSLPYLGGGLGLIAVVALPLFLRRRRATQS